MNHVNITINMFHLYLIHLMFNLRQSIFSKKPIVLTAFTSLVIAGFVMSRPFLIFGIVPRRDWNWPIKYSAAKKIKHIIKFHFSKSKFFIARRDFILFFKFTIKTYTNLSKKNSHPEVCIFLWFVVMWSWKL